MPTDKSATILEAQWMEKEIPRMEEELQILKELEQELLTAPLETVNQAYTSTFRAARKRAYPFYHRRRSVTPTRYGYKERMVDVGWFAAVARVLIVVVAVLAVYFTYYHRLEDTRRGIIWGSALLVAAIVLSVAPPLADYAWERLARRKAQRAADTIRQSKAFLQEKQERQARLEQGRARASNLEERIRFAYIRLDELRKELTSNNHRDSVG